MLALLSVALIQFPGEFNGTEMRPRKSLPQLTTVTGRAKVEGLERAKVECKMMCSL
jgi:hypothetical protein